MKNLWARKSQMLSKLKTRKTQNCLKNNNKTTYPRKRKSKKFRMKEKLIAKPKQPSMSRLMKIFAYCKLTSIMLIAYWMELLIAWFRKLILVLRPVGSRLNIIIGTWLTTVLRTQLVCPGETILRVTISKPSCHIPFLTRLRFLDENLYLNTTIKKI